MYKTGQVRFFRPPIWAYCKRNQQSDRAYYAEIVSIDNNRSMHAYKLCTACVCLTYVKITYIKMRTYVSKMACIPSVYARAMSTTHFRSVLRTSCYNKISELVINLVTLSYALTIFTTTHVSIQSKTTTRSS